MSCLAVRRATANRIAKRLTQWPSLLERVRAWFWRFLLGEAEKLKAILFNPSRRATCQRRLSSS